MVRVCRFDEGRRWPRREPVQPLYRYFPSKTHLLVSGLARELERIQDKLDRTAIPGDTPYDRMLYVLGRVTRSMQREPMLTEAMTRAFMFADPSAAAEVNTVAR